MERRSTIAIDGPAGAGKSTTAAEVAKALGYVHYNSGISYRAITLIVDDVDNEEAVRKLKIENVGERVFHDGCDVTPQLWSADIDARVSTVAKLRHVREKCHAMLRTFVEDGGVGIVVEGRDIGTEALPDADMKIFLTASVEARAQRRVDQNGGDYAAVKQSISKRDEDDVNRVIGPLRRAADAVAIDNGALSLDETVAKIVEIAKSRGLENGGFK